MTYPSSPKDISHDPLDTSVGEEDFEPCDYDPDLRTEKIGFLVSGWRARIREQATKLYAAKENEELWAYFGLDNKEIQHHWYLHTVQWVRKHAVAGTKSKPLEDLYEKYCIRFQKLAKSMKRKKREEEYSSTVEKYSYLLASSSSPLSPEVLLQVSLEKEGPSAVFHILRERPETVRCLDGGLNVLK